MAKSRGRVSDLTDLPHDLFLAVASLLAPHDAVVCRCVSRRWLVAFASDEVARCLMRRHFPTCRETRELLAGRSLDWSRAFPRVARRYYHLRAARPRLVEQIEVIQEGKQCGLHRGVEPWARWLRWNENLAPFHHRDPTWTLDDGLLVYPEKISGRYVAYDLETRHRISVPFDTAGKVVRRIRLSSGVLVFEWCEREPFHMLNAREQVHRHFATAFDVQRLAPRDSSTSPPRSPSSTPPSTLRPRPSVVRSLSPPSAPWAVAFRSEWKIHFLGLPLNRHDRFFSAHTATHYAVYLWQPNRSPWGEEDPLEQLTVWDISFPSAYRPSQDPSGAHRPDPDLAPIVVRRFTWRELEHLGLRQRHTPSMSEMLLDEANIYIHEEEHRWLVGQHSSLSPPRHHHVRCIAIPFTGTGPRWYDECCADGDVNMSFCPRSGSAARLAGQRREASTAAAAADWPGRAPCWRHEEFPYLTVSDVVDVAAGVRIVARQCFVMEALSAFVLPKLSSVVGGSRCQNRGALQGQAESSEGPDEVPESRFDDQTWSQIMAKGRLVGDERWVVGEAESGSITIMRF